MGEILEANTTIIRSNFMYDENARFNEFGMNLWRNMSQELNFNVMFSPRGIINLSSFRCSNECIRT